MSALKSHKRTDYAQHGQCSRPRETKPFYDQHGRDGRGRRDCRRGAALSSLLIKPTHRMARPPCRHMHRAGTWINPCKPRQGSQCSSCHSTCLNFRAHSLGGCCQQLAVTASGWWMVYYTASITLIHSSEGKPPVRCPPRLLGCRGGRAADSTEAARARRRVLTLGVEGGGEC